MNRSRKRRRDPLPANVGDVDGYDAVEAFERFFRLDTLYVSGAFTNPNTPESYSCMVSGLNRFDYARSVQVVFSQDEPMTWYCPLVYYSASIDMVLETYLGYLRDDPYSLALWLCEGEEPGDDIFPNGGDRHERRSI